MTDGEIDADGPRKVIDYGRRRWDSRTAANARKIAKEMNIPWDRVNVPAVIHHAFQADIKVLTDFRDYLDQRSQCMKGISTLDCSEVVHTSVYADDIDVLDDLFDEVHYLLKEIGKPDIWKWQRYIQASFLDVKV
jgi:hypothetical protein